MNGRAGGLVRLGRTLLMLIPAFALPGCSALDLVDWLTPRGTYRLEPDQAYGSDPRQRLDVYRPAAGEDPARPVVVFFYGGAWRFGARGEYRFVGESFARAGYVTIIPDYRLYPSVRFPTFVEDAAAATGWVARHLLLPDGRPRPIVLIGHSAGAYLVAMLAADPRYLDADHGPGRRVVREWIGLAGPYGFEPTGEDVTILASPDGRPVMPADLADAGTPPALLLLAGADEVVGRINAERMAARLRSVGVPVRCKTYPGLSHARLAGALASSLGLLGPVRADILAELGALQEPAGPLDPTAGSRASGSDH